MSYSPRIYKASLFATRLNDLIGKTVTITLEGGAILTGKFLGHDKHLNVLVFSEGRRLVIRGTSIFIIAEGNQPVVLKREKEGVDVDD